MNKYLIIYCSQDGEHSIERISKEQLERRLNDKHYGDAPILEMNESRVDFNTQYGVFIIKGEIVLPKPLKVIQQWEI